MIERLRNRWSRARSREPVRVTLYSRPGCHLCESVRASLQKLAPRYPMTIEEIDISTSRELVRRYDLLIPVVRVDGGPELAAPITEPDLVRVLKARVRG